MRLASGLTVDGDCPELTTSGIHRFVQSCRLDQFCFVLDVRLTSNVVMTILLTVPDVRSVATGWGRF